MLNYSEKVNVELTLILLSIKTRISVQYDHISDTFIICSCRKMEGKKIADKVPFLCKLIRLMTSVQ